MKPRDLEAAGVNRVARVVGVEDCLPKLEDGSTLNPKNVIWCTGYEHGFPWIHLPVFDAKGEPMHDRGVVPNVPGLYFVGLHFLYAMTSANLLGVGRDAKRIVRAVAGRSRQDNAQAEEIRPHANSVEMSGPPRVSGKAVLVSVGGGCSPRVQVELEKDVAHMTGHGLVADVELQRDFVVRHSAGDEPQASNSRLVRRPDGCEGPWIRVCAFASSTWAPSSLKVRWAALSSNIAFSSSPRAR